MKMRFSVCVRIIGATLVLAAPALAASDADWNQCAETNNRASADRNIAACNRILNDGSEAPYRARALSNRCALWKTKGEIDRAIVDCNQAIRLDPKLGPAYGNRGNAYTEKGDLDRAIADYDQALRLNPTATKYGNRATAYLRKGDYATAIANYTQAIQLDPNNAFSLYWRGRAKQQIGDNAGGDIDVAAAKQIDPHIGE
jgi:tetratricopeptide (TPR) repeat protein